MSHTILLVQLKRKGESRTYHDFESVNEGMEGVCKIYEEHLSVLNLTPRCQSDEQNELCKDQMPKPNFLMGESFSLGQKKNKKSRNPLGQA